MQPSNQGGPCIPGLKRRGFAAQLVILVNAHSHQVMGPATNPRSIRVRARKRSCRKVPWSNSVPSNRFFALPHCPNLGVMLGR